MTDTCAATRGTDRLWGLFFWPSAVIIALVPTVILAPWIRPFLEDDTDATPLSHEAGVFFWCLVILALAVALRFHFAPPVRDLSRRLGREAFRAHVSRVFRRQLPHAALLGGALLVFVPDLGFPFKLIEMAVVLGAIFYLTEKRSGAVKALVANLDPAQTPASTA